MDYETLPYDFALCMCFYVQERILVRLKGSSGHSIYIFEIIENIGSGVSCLELSNTVTTKEGLVFLTFFLFSHYNFWNDQLS